MTAAVKDRETPWHRRARHALAYSLRVRLVALFLLLALAMAIAFLVGMQYALGVGWRNAARPLVVDYVDRLAAEIGSPPSPQRAQEIARKLPLSVRISGPEVNWRSNPQEPDHQYPRRDRHDPEQSAGGDNPRFFERISADGHRIHLGLRVEVWQDRPRSIGWMTLAVLLVLTALAYARVRYLLRPLDDIRGGAQRFGAGDFAHPIAVRNPGKTDELGDLACTINTMGADIHQMLEAKRALLLAISHELRSPLTRARLNTELLPETAEVQVQRDALLRDLALMRDLVTDLLESERLASPHAALQREPVDLVALVRDVVAQLPGATAVTLTLAVDAFPLQLDSGRMRLLVRNLLANALQHSPDALQPPVIGLSRADDGAVVLTVRDFGAGVSEDQLPRLTDPFYRTDTSRTRDSGGVGLGLYLCRLVAQAHGGTLTLRNATPGLEAVVQLPRHPHPDGV